MRLCLAVEPDQVAIIPIFLSVRHNTGQLKYLTARSPASSSFLSKDHHHPLRARTGQALCRLSSQTTKARLILRLRDLSLTMSTATSRSRKNIGHRLSITLRALLSRVAGGDSGAFGLSGSFSVCWRDRSCHCALLAQTSLRRSWWIGTGHSLPPRRGFCAYSTCSSLRPAANLFIRYFSLFITYTPYTIYKCELPLVFAWRI